MNDYILENSFYEITPRRYLFETTFEKEVFSDLTGERGALMGAIQGLFQAQYEVLREHGNLNDLYNMMHYL